MSQAEKTNILVLMSDQHSKHVSGCYGNDIVRTPNLDRLASEGMRFTNAYCPSPLCGPSRMSFMTSRYPSGNRVWHNQHILNSAIPTWAHVLGSAGYETSLIGRMHFMGPDQRHGFENRAVGEYIIHPGVPEKGGPRWTQFPETTCGMIRETVEIAGTGNSTYQWYDEQVTSATLQYLQDKSKDNDRRPFAAVAGFVLPHCPFVAQKELFEYYYDRVNIPIIEENQPPNILKHRSRQGTLDPPLDEERVRVARAVYFALCEQYDSMVGEILDCLEETGLAKNTLVIYCTDHGEMAGEHGCWFKASYYEGSVGTPLIARLPGVIEPDTVSHAVCNLIDIGPTLAEVAGGTNLPQWDGRSLWQTFQGNHPSDWVDETFSEVCYYEYPTKMIRSGEWKLWVDDDHEQTPPALFNLKNDPDEEQDLGQDKSYTDISRELLEKLYRGWNPADVRASTKEMKQWYRTLAQWGETIQPEHPDQLPLPPPELESDFEQR